MSRCRLASALALSIALAACGGSSSSDPTDEELFQAGLADYDALRYADAQASFDELLDLYPDSPRADNAAYLAGRCSYELLAYPDAIARLTSMTTTYPDSNWFSSAAYFTGRSRFKTLDYAGAAPDFQAALDTDPAGVWADNAAYYVGRSHFEAGSFAAAITELGGFESAFPDSSYVDNERFYLGRAYLGAAQYPQALAALQSVFEISGTIFADNAQLWIGITDYTAGDLTAALADFETLVQDYATSVHADNGLYYEVRIHTDQLDCTGAATALQRLESTYPASTWIATSQTYMQTGGCP